MTEQEGHTEDEKKRNARSFSPFDTRKDAGPL